MPKVGFEINSKLVRIELEKNGKSMTWLAATVGIKPPYLSMLMTHKRNPGIKLREALYAAINGATLLPWSDIFKEKK